VPIGWLQAWLAICECPFHQSGNEGIPLQIVKEDSLPFDKNEKLSKCFKCSSSV